MPISHRRLICFRDRRHLGRAAVDGLELLDTARAVAEFDLPMRLLGLWWGS